MTGPPDPFTDTLNRFVANLSEKVVACAEHADDAGVAEIVGTLLDATRQTIANLLLVELECERILRHG